MHVKIVLRRDLEVAASRHGPEAVVVDSGAHALAAADSADLVLVAVDSAAHVPSGAEGSAVRVLVALVAHQLDPEGETGARTSVLQLHRNGCAARKRTPPPSACAQA